MASAAAISPAREIVAAVIARRGPGYRNLADNVRTGGTPNQFIQFAVDAVEDALRSPRDADD